MQIVVELPDNLVEHVNPGREALEALAIEGFRSGALSNYQTRLLLGFETGAELDGFLKEHEVWEHSYGIEELQQDADSFHRGS